MRTLKFSRKMERGTWKFVKNKVLVQCPNCDTGVVIELRDVTDDGIVFDFECLCPFDEDVVLQGYGSQ